MNFRSTGLKFRYINCRWEPVHVKTYEQWESRTMCREKDNTEQLLGYLDTTFLFSYAFGLFFSGLIGDRFNPRYVLSVV